MNRTATGINRTATKFGLLSVAFMLSLSAYGAGVAEGRVAEPPRSEPGRVGEGPRGSAPFTLKSPTSTPILDGIITRNAPAPPASPFKPAPPTTPNSQSPGSCPVVTAADLAMGTDALPEEIARYVAADELSNGNCEEPLVKTNPNIRQIIFSMLRGARDHHSLSDLSASLAKVKKGWTFAQASKALTQIAETCGWVKINGIVPAGAG